MMKGAVVVIAQQNKLAAANKWQRGDRFSAALQLQNGTCAKR